MNVILVSFVCGVQLLDCRQSEFERDVGKNGHHLNYVGCSIEAVVFDVGRRCVLGGGQIKN